MNEPRTISDYRDLILAHCAICERRDGTACKVCPLHVVYSMPQVLILKLRHEDRLHDQISMAMSVASNSNEFTVTAVRDAYYHRYGNGASLNWGALTVRREWRERFERCGEIPSTSRRTHGKKVLLWKRRG